MPHGAPDWYKYRRNSTTHPVDDLAELAARLDSPVVFDRRGDVIFMETFENGLGAWSTSLFGNGAAVELSPVLYLTRGYSCKMTGGKDGLRTAHLQHYHNLHHLAQFGFEISGTFDTNIQYAQITISIYDIATTSDFGIRFDLLNNEFVYIDPNGDWTTLASFPSFYTSVPTFYTIKLVVDPVTGLYIRLVTPNRQDNLSVLSGSQTTVAAAARILLQFSITSKADTNAVSYVDNIILTIDEP